MSPARITELDVDQPLSPAAVDAVTALVAEAERVDRSAPLSEQFTLAVTSRGEPGVSHRLAETADGRLVGYAQVRSGPGDESPSAELVVAPDARRAGVGSALLAALPTDARVWSHASGPVGEGAAAFAEAAGRRPVRSLHVMGRPLQSGPSWGPAAVPEPYAVRTFVPGRDEDAWVSVNAAAFATHPEQGALRRADLEQRMASPWFDPAGLFLITPQDEPDDIAAFHWTKVDPPGGTVGEVYVVAVAPDHQKRGLGRAVTVLGLDHLKGLGLAQVELYVDEENRAAVHTYAGLGFTDVAVHRQFARR